MASASRGTRRTRVPALLALALASVLGLSGIIAAPASAGTPVASPRPTPPSAADFWCELLGADQFPPGVCH